MNSARTDSVEAGGKAVIGQRAKQSGMRWTEPGLLNALHSCCALLGGQFCRFWDQLNHSALPIPSCGA